MSYDTPGQRPLPLPESAAAVMESLLVQALEEPRETAVVKKPGRPARLSSPASAPPIAPAPKIT